MKRMFLLVLLMCTQVWGQSNQATLDVTITPYVTYYISSIDLETGESTIPIFNATLTPAADNTSASVYFEIVINSEALDLYNETLLSIKSSPFVFSNSIVLSNTSLNLDTREIFDVHGNQIDFTVPSDNIEHIDMAEADEIFNQVVQTGRLPDGTYTFIIQLIDGDDDITVIQNYEESIKVTTPTYLQLSTPGGPLADTLENEIFTSYPVFQWETDPCNVPGGCGYYIKVAEFDPSVHSSADEAIESLTRLPLDQSQNFYFVGNGVSSFQYPTSNAGDLEPGKVYAWQVLKVMGSTEGAKGILSEILTFKIKDLTAAEPAGESSPVVLTEKKTALKSLMGETLFSNLNTKFPGFKVSGIQIDGETVDITKVQSLLNQGVPVTADDGTITYRSLSVVSVEVVE